AFFNSLYQVYYTCRPIKHSHVTQVYPSIVWGATVHNRDRLSEKLEYLPEMNIGDWIIFEEIGGYSLSVTCEYQGLPS
ncbi:hypothetical protein ACJEKH_26320, partial [Escherichia coli]